MDFRFWKIMLERYCCIFIKVNATNNIVTSKSETLTNAATSTE